jgi:hypothetical protein
MPRRKKGPNTVAGLINMVALRLDSAMDWGTRERGHAEPGEKRVSRQHHRRIKPIHDELTERQDRLDREEDDRDALRA